MAKGYWVVFADVTDPAGYKEYQALNVAPFAEYGARFLVRGGTQEQVLGEGRSRTVVIEFPSFEAAKACFHSEAYQQALEVRKMHSQSEQVIVAGYDEPGAA